MQTDLVTDDRIAVTIITGFLGSGKTTFLNQIISDYPDKKFAIIENEFGEIGIDGALIQSKNEKIVELSNGCICCTLHSGFYDSVVQLLKSSYSFDHLLIETTGVADPDPIIKTFIGGDGLRHRFRLDSVLCVADSSHTQAHLQQRPEVRKQLALADVIVINKSDQVTSPQLAGLTDLVGKLNPMATIVPATFGRIEELNLLEVDGYSPQTLESSILSVNTSREFYDTVFSQENDHDHHSLSIKSISFMIPGQLDLGMFTMWLQKFIFLHRNRIYRVKGILCFAERQEKYILQLVKDIYGFETNGVWKNEEKFSKLVFIGTGLDKDRIEDQLYSLLFTSATV